jgi:hypothetical protein
MGRGEISSGAACVWPSAKATLAEGCDFSTIVEGEQTSSRVYYTLAKRHHKTLPPLSRVDPYIWNCGQDKHEAMPKAIWFFVSQ